MGKRYEGDGTNLYAYCRNNPIQYYNPSVYRGETNEKGHITSKGEEGKTPSTITEGGEWGFTRLQRTLYT